MSALMFSPYLDHWNLVADGTAIITDYSRLLPVRMRDGSKAMLKIALVPEERFGASVMAWWDGVGAAKVFEYAGDALLMERALPDPQLDIMAVNGEDDEAIRVLCSTAATLHGKTDEPPSGLIPLERRFDSLFAAAAVHGGIFRHSADAAAELLASQSDSRVLHGDLHHGNVLNFGPRGWLAIDPKGLIGDRSFEYCCLFGNPDPCAALRRGRLARQAGIVSRTAAIDRPRLLKWIHAWAGLSAAMMLADDAGGIDARLDLARLAAAEMAS